MRTERVKAAVKQGALRGLWVAGIVLSLPPVCALAFRAGFFLHTGDWVPLGDTPFGY